MVRANLRALSCPAEFEFKEGLTKVLRLVDCGSNRRDEETPRSIGISTTTVVTMCTSSLHARYKCVQWPARMYSGAGAAKKGNRTGWIVIINLEQFWTRLRYTPTKISLHSMVSVDSADTPLWEPINDPNVSWLPQVNTWLGRCNRQVGLLNSPPFCN